MKSSQGKDEKQQLMQQRDAIRNKFEDDVANGNEPEAGTIYKLRALNRAIADESVYCLRCRIHHSGPQC